MIRLQKMIRLRHFVAALALALSASFTSSAQAGIIPWVYDVIFGPVHSRHDYAPAYSYSPAPMSYSQPAYSYPSTYSYSGYAGGYGCQPCQTRCNTCATAPSGSAKPAAQQQQQPQSTVAFYHPFYGWVSQSCPAASSAPQTAAKPSPDKVGSRVPDPKATFAEDIEQVAGQKADPFVAPMSVKKPVAPRNGDAATVDDAAAGDAKPKFEATTPPAAGTNSNAPAKPGDAGFAEQPQRGTEPNFVTPLDGETQPEKSGEKTKPIELDDVSKGLNLDNKSTWVVPAPGVERIAFRPGFRNARLARHSDVVNVDFVIPATSVTRIVSK